MCAVLTPPVTSPWCHVAVTEAYPRLRKEMDDFAAAKAAGYKEQNARAMSRHSRRPSSALASSLAALPLRLRRPSFVSASTAPLINEKFDLKRKRRPSFCGRSAGAFSRSSPAGLAGAPAPAPEPAPGLEA